MFSLFNNPQALNHFRAGLEQLNQAQQAFFPPIQQAVKDAVSQKGSALADFWTAWKPNIQIIVIRTEDASAAGQSQGDSASGSGHVSSRATSLEHMVAVSETEGLPLAQGVTPYATATDR